jgi:dihydroorotate dehydrogenase (NAD+) catalytic subunit
MDLSVQIGTASFQNPVTVASGTFGHSERYYNLEEVKKLGAITPKTVTLNAREGNPPQRIVETPCGMLNAIGIENPGVDGFIEKKLPALREIGPPLIISILGHTDKEFQILTEKFNAVEGVCVLELNLSCPNLGRQSLVAQDPKATYRLVKAVKKICRYPVVAKLSPNVTDITVVAEAAEEAGADGLSLINTFTGMVIDVQSRTSVLGNVTGGLSGPAIRPAAVYMVYKTAKKVKIPIVAMGGGHDSRRRLTVYYCRRDDGGRRDGQFYQPPGSAGGP